MNRLVTYHINALFPECDRIVEILGTLHVVLACMIHQYSAMDAMLPEDSIIRSSSFFMNDTVSQLSNFLKFSIPDGGDTSYLQKCTGIPVHTILLGHLQYLSKKVEPFVPKMTTVFQKEFEERNLGYVSEAKLHLVMQEKMTKLKYSLTLSELITPP